MKKEIIAASAIKIILALLFWMAIGHKPYSYYQFIKFAAFVGCGVLVYLYKNNSIAEALIAAVGVMFFNPFYKVTFKRNTWQEIDYLIAAICAAWVVADLIKLFVISRNERKKAKEGTTQEIRQH